MPPETDDLMTRAQSLFERDPTVGAISIVVAGNLLPGAQTVDVESFDGKVYPTQLPNWDADAWGWWLDLVLGIGDSANDVKAEMKPRTNDATELRVSALYKEVQAARAELLTAAASSDRVSGNDEIGWLAIAGRILMVGGRFLVANGARVIKWGRPFVVAFGKGAWKRATVFFKKAPWSITAGLAALVAPVTAIKVVTVAADMVGKLFGGVAKGILSGMGPLAIALIAWGAYEMFWKKKGD